MSARDAQGHGGLIGDATSAAAHCHQQVQHALALIGGQVAQQQVVDRLTPGLQATQHFQPVGRDAQQLATAILRIVLLADQAFANQPPPARMTGKSSWLCALPS